MERNVYVRQYNQNRNHWWFEGRKLILSRILNKYISKKKIILDYGCGEGVWSSSVVKKIYLYDKNKKLIPFLKKKYIINKKFH